MGKILSLNVFLLASINSYAKDTTQDNIEFCKEICVGMARLGTLDNKENARLML